jgi:hypothetical protein
MTAVRILIVQGPHFSLPSGDAVSMDRLQYMGFVLRVHGLCTASTWLLYFEYMGFVLPAQRLNDDECWQAWSG